MIRYLRVTLALGILASVQIARAASDEEILHDKLQQYYNQIHNTRVPALTAETWRALASQFTAEAPHWGQSCQDVGKTVILGQYVYTTDSAKKPCHIYDLTFPTVQTLFASRAVAQVPVQSFGAGDYLNLIRGDYSAVVGKVQNFRNSFAQIQNGEIASWVKDVKFKAHRVHALSAQPKVEGVGLPRDFFASDLETGTALRFSAEDQAALLALVKASGLDTKAWRAFAANPESVLANIHFSWNDAEKVFNVLLEGEFLPLRGPIALVDYQAPYKLAVEGILRSLVHSALSTAVGFIPAPAKNLITIALDDSFEFMDAAYDYQLNRLEATLASAQATMDGATMTRSLSLIGAARASFATEYLMGAIQGQNFDWTQLEQSGRKITYDRATARDAELNKINSSLVLDQGCDMQLKFSYFGVCMNDGKRSLYSLISENSILFWNIGAPKIHNYDWTSEIMLKRGAGYLLSVGSRLAQLPYVGFLLGTLTSACKTYAFAGVSDEGYLRGSLNVLKINGLNAEDKNLSTWLYLQNLNGFLAKTDAQETSIVQANARLLGIQNLNN